MSPIDPLGPLLQQIRASALARERRAESTHGSPAAEDPGASRAEHGNAWLDGVLGAVAAIPAEDPQRRRKAFRAYLEGVLAREFAIAAPAGPEFQALVDQVHGSLDANPRLRSALDAAADHLIERAGR